MQLLPNNCRVGKMTVVPKNWQSPKADVHLIWKITYWFYDDNLKKRKMIVVKRVNRIYNLFEKQQLMKTVLAGELTLLNKGRNPITKNTPVTGEVNQISSLKYEEIEKMKLSIFDLSAALITATDALSACLKNQKYPSR